MTPETSRGAKKISLKLPSRTASGAEKYEAYRRELARLGVPEPKDGRALVVGLRGLSSGGVLHPTRFTQKFDDVFVVLHPDGHAAEFRGSTHPSRKRSPDAMDADGDGVPDVGMIRPGRYRAVPRGDYKGHPAYDLLHPDGRAELLGWRNTRHTGILTDEEKRASEERGDRMTGILVHRSLPTAPGSIGCQSVEARRYDAFVDAVGGPDAEFDYVLADLATQQERQHRIGEDTVVHVETWAKDSGLTFVNVHEDERTSVSATKSFLAARGGRLVHLIHGGGRRISFRLDGRDFSFDPNRIFTHEGVVATLSEAGPVPDAAVEAVSGFAAALLRKLEGAPLVVAMHNNTPGGYSAKSYLPGGEEGANARAVHLEPGVDPDNFFLVTEPAHYEALAALGHNVVLQSERPENDGSLSVYMAKSKRPYVLVEAVHGAYLEQRRMLESLRTAVGA